MNSGTTDDKKGSALAAQRFQMLEDIAAELAGDVVFPTAFDVVMRLRKALQDPNLSIDHLADMIILEPLISGRLLGLANSAAFSRRGPEVRGVKAAVVRLGLNTVRSTAMAIAMNQLLRSKDLVPFNDLANHLWEHSLRTAVAAEIIARKMTHISPDEAMLAGLVHDLGAFYMLYRASQYEELRQRPDTVRHLISQWHESIGHSLLIALSLPETVADAMRDHDQPRPMPLPARTLSDIVYIANLMAGGKFEWLYRDADSGAAIDFALPAEYQALTGEVEQREHEMRAAFA